MSAFDSAVAIDQSTFVAAQDATLDVDSRSSATAEADSVSGISQGAAVITNAVGVLDSPLSFGTNGVIDVNQNGIARASASTIDQLNQIGGITPTAFGTAAGVSDTYTLSGHSLQDGDRILADFASTGDLVSRFVVDVDSAAGTFRLAFDPAGERIDTANKISALSAATTELVASTAYAGFTGDSLNPQVGQAPTGTGGIIDSSDAANVDIVVGQNATIAVVANNQAEAKAENTLGDAYSTANIVETFGLNQVGLNVGVQGTLAVDIDADASATAVTIGDPRAATLGTGGDANADADASRVIAINDLGNGPGDFDLGQQATIRGNAGSLSDRISISGVASTQTGEATATAHAVSITGIRDDQDGNTASTANLLSVGDAGTVVGTANAAFIANASSTTGNAAATAAADEVNGFHADEVAIGRTAKVQGQADSTMVVSASVVDGIVPDSGTAIASGSLNETKGLTLEQLAVGDRAVGDAGTYNILGRSNADLQVNSSSLGADTIGDRASSLARVTEAEGLELGAAGTQDALNVGTAASIAGVTDLGLTAAAESTSGEVDAAALLTSGIGFDLRNKAAIGSSGTILAQADVDLDASALNVGASARPTAEVDAGAGFVAGLDAGETLAAGGADAEIQFGQNAAITARATVTADATARSVSGDFVSAEAGNTTANSTASSGPLAPGATMEVYGLHTNNDLTSGAAATIDADAKATLKATATNVGVVGQASSVAADAQLRRAVGLDTDAAGAALTIGTEATITADSVVSGTAESTSTEGSANAAAIVSENAGANTNLINVGGSGSLLAAATSTQTATAQTVTLDGTARALSTSNIGLNADGALSFGETGAVQGTATGTNRATAGSIDEDAWAAAHSLENIGVDASASLTLGTGGSLRGIASLTNAAIARTVGDGTVDGGEDLAWAVAAYDTVNIGIRADGATTSFGTTGLVQGAAASNTAASATATDGQADADVVVAESLGVDLGSQTLMIGSEGRVVAATSGVNNSTATTVDGEADALIRVAMGHGLGDGNGVVRIGTDGVLDTDADFTNTATATATDGNDAGSGGVIQAKVDNDSVAAIDLASLINGTNLQLDADAVSRQTASSSTIGDPSLATSTEAKAFAEVARNDQISGINTTVISVGANTTQLTASATLAASATANNMADESEASAGYGSDVTALDSGGDLGLEIGGNATNGMRFDALSNLAATALSVEDQAQAYTGSNSFSSQVANGADAADLNTASGQSTLASLTANPPLSAVTGVKNTDMTVGRDSGLLVATANSTLAARAQTTGTGSGDQDAVAIVSQAADGVVDSDVSIGASGSLTASSTLKGDVVASNIGNIGSQNDAFARLQLDADGIEQTSNEVITIGVNGSVKGQAFASGSAVAETVNGSAEVQGDLDAFGFDLQNAAADVTVGRQGDISGLAILGALSNGNFSEQIELTATTRSEDALVLGTFDAAGIRGTDTGFSRSNLAGSDQTLLTVGPLGGQLTGQALGGVKAVASTIGDPASTGPSSGDNAVIEIDSTLSGLQDVDILGSQFATYDLNGVLKDAFIKGTSYGDFDSNASSVKGDALAHSDVNAYGIFDANEDGIISASGDISAIAQIYNTVIASTVNGDASATAITDAIGIHGYHINLNSSGVFRASAESESSSISSTVNGRAGS